MADSPPPLPSSPAHSACRCISSVFLAAHSPQTTLHPRDPATADRTAACRTSASHGRKVALPARFYHSKPLHSMSTALDTRSSHSTRSVTSFLTPSRLLCPYWRTSRSRRSRLPPFSPRCPRRSAEFLSNRGSNPSPSSGPTGCGSERLHQTWKPWKLG